MAKPRASLRKDFLHALLKSAYLPADLPPIVTARYFAEFSRNNFAVLDKKSDHYTAKSTEYAVFSVPRPNTGRRKLAIVSPIAQLGLSLLITNRRSDIKKTLTSSAISMYGLDENLADGRAFRGLDFDQWHEKIYQIGSDYPFAVEADISRFFYTTYTHSFPWAVLGKKKAKELAKIKKNDTWSDKLDLAIRRCQSSETFGIPVGPDTSRIIAELLMVGVEGHPSLKRHLAQDNAVRLIDDFYIGCNSEDDARKILSDLETALWDFNLQLNEDKSGVKPTKHKHTEIWRYEFDSIKTKHLNSKDERSTILGLLDKALHLSAIEGNELPAVWASRRLLNLNRYEENLSLLLDTFLRLGRDFPSTMKHVSEFIINNREIFHDEKRAKKLRRWIVSSIRSNLPKENDLEVALALFICGVLSISLEKNDFPEFETLPGPVSFALIGLLRQHRLLNFPLGEWNWRPTYKQMGATSPIWLPLYEAVLRGWTSDKSLEKEVTKLPLLNELRKNKVTFLDDGLFKLAQINFARRFYTFKNKKITANRTVKLSTNKYT